MWFILNLFMNCWLVYVLICNWKIFKVTYWRLKQTIFFLWLTIKWTFLLIYQVSLQSFSLRYWYKCIALMTLLECTDEQENNWPSTAGELNCFPRRLLSNEKNKKKEKTSVTSDGGEEEFNVNENRDRSSLL